MLLDGCDVDKMNNQIEIIKDLENRNFKSFLENLKELIEEYSFCNHEKFKVLYVEWEYFLNFKERIEKYLDEIIKIEEKKQIDKLEKKQNRKLNS